VINNAGYRLFGAVEELGEQDVHNIIDANLLGTPWVMQAALPLIRAQGSLPAFQPENYGAPLATLPAILKLVDAPNPPLRLFMVATQFTELLE
jgi:NAD(P)-dependent dehydrogenase (short-subunit alcohol dehydrogenase family)